MEEAEVPLEHLHEEIHHHAEHGGAPWISGVALSTAILAVLAAISGLLSGKHANEAMMSQIESSDQWLYFQAKSIRRHADQSVVDLVSVLTARDKDRDRDKDKGAEQIAKVREIYQAEVERYRDDQNELEAEAKKLEVEAEKEYKR